jgi:Cdc6-like AAA superfamily ATPase
MAVSYSGLGGFEKITGDPGVGKTLALRTYVDSLNER